MLAAIYQGSLPTIEGTNSELGRTTKLYRGSVLVVKPRFGAVVLREDLAESAPFSFGRTVKSASV